MEKQLKKPRKSYVNIIVNVLRYVDWFVTDFLLLEVAIWARMMLIAGPSLFVTTPEMINKVHAFASSYRRLKVCESIRMNIERNIHKGAAFA